MLFNVYILLLAFGRVRNWAAEILIIQLSRGRLCQRRHRVNVREQKILIIVNENERETSNDEKKKQQILR